jgi:cation diffusion facilitator family transporter
MECTNEQLALRISRRCLIGNAALGLFKLGAGVAGHSAAMISDAVHSFSDVFSTIIVMIGVRLANRESDKEHPYGHERFECVAALILAMLLGVTSAGIGWFGLRQIFAGDVAALPVPGVLPLVAAAVSLVVKEAMYRRTRAVAREIDSAALLADAWHHRTDALSSIDSFAGILGARQGLPFLDPLASIIICLFVVRAAVLVFRNAVGKMTDRACPDAEVEKIRAVILAHTRVMGIDQLRTRLFGDKIYVDVEISVNGGVSLEEAHEVAHQIHDTIEKRLPRVKHCMVHVNPAESASPAR